MGIAALEEAAAEEENEHLSLAALLAAADADGIAVVNRDVDVPLGTFLAALRTAPAAPRRPNAHDALV